MSAVLIIAEAGVNHNGNIQKAKELVDTAKNAGADIIKFQTFKAEKLVSKSAQKAQYQAENTNDRDNSQFTMLKKLELSVTEHLELIEYCEKKRIRYLSTGFDEESLDQLDQQGVPFFKIPSGEITNKPYLQHLAVKRKPVILSTGMSDIKEIGEALKTLTCKGLSKDQITILHCNTGYPTPMKDVNLRAMLTIQDTFNVKVGLSDHTLGIEVPIAAVALGATVIEKHFTLSRTMQGPDHKASLEPDELIEMVIAIRNIEMALSGDGHKIPTPSEKPNIPVVRRSIHYSKNLKKGHSLSMKDIIMKRPGDGISPMEYEKFLGMILKTDVCKDQKLAWGDLG
jgi:N,N'-diacetyllegionaminate synthase